MQHYNYIANDLVAEKMNTFLKNQLVPGNAYCVTMFDCRCIQHLLARDLGSHMHLSDALNRYIQGGLR